MSREARRMLELQAAGIAMSRNRHFDLFEQEENRGALRLFRKLRYWSEMIRQHHRRGREIMRIRTENHRHPKTHADRFEVVIEMPSIAGSETLYLTELEYRLLREQPGMSEYLPAFAPKASGARHAAQTSAS